MSARARRLAAALAIVAAHAAALAATLAAAHAASAQQLQLQLFARGADGHVLHATAPSSWQRLGAQSVGAPDAAAGGGFAVRGTDDALWWIPLAGEPERVEAVLRSGPGAAWHAQSGLAVAAIGSDGAAWLVLRTGGKWRAWESLGGLFPDGATPDLAWTSAERLEIVARGQDGAAWRGARDKGAWSGWSPSGESLAGDPALADGELVRIGSDLQGHHGPTPLGGQFPAGAGIDACSDGLGVLAVTARGQDGAAWVNLRSGGSWSGWSSWGGSIDGDVTCAFVKDGPAAPQPPASKDPWSDPGALQEALVRWAEPIGEDAVRKAGPLEQFAMGMTLDASMIAAHVVRPKLAEPVTIESPVAVTSDVAGEARIVELDELAYRSGAIAALAGSAGYFLELRRLGQPVLTLQKNWARPPGGTSPGLDWTSSRRMHVASVSKLVTAMAMVRLLEERGIPLDARIDAYLPAAWTAGPGIDRVTFRHLLTHFSGLSTPGGDASYPGMRTAIAAGSTGTTAYQYQNVNYGLCRILLPVVAGTISRDRAFGPSLLPAVTTDAIWDAVAVQAYVRNVQDHVLGPAGVTEATIAPVRDDALAQRLPVSGPGWESDDPRMLFYMTGTVGWHFTPHELLELMATFRRGGVILNEDSARRMIEAGIGVDYRTRSRAGLVATKDGYWEVQSLGCEQAIASFLPGDMELVVFVNSRIAPGSGPGALATTMDRLYVSSLRP